jgi:MYXO-CTERM domain-containing protein
MLAAAGTASAKQPLSATVCGASGCRAVTDRPALLGIPSGENTTALGSSAPYYLVKVVSGEPESGEVHSTFLLHYIPSANAMAWAEDGIVRAHPIYGPEAPALMRRLTAGIAPFRPRVTAVVVGKRRVAGPAAATYLRLFDQNEIAAEAPSQTDRVRIDLQSPRRSPWTDGNPDLMYSSSANIVERGWSRFELPKSLAADVEAGRPLAASSSPQTTPWAISLVVLGLGALGGAAHMRRRRR